MEKKITKKFLMFSSLNVISAIVLAGGDPKDSLALIAVLIVLILNHATLLRLISEAMRSMTLNGDDAKRALRKTFFLMFAKMMLLAIIVASIYFYKQELTLKVLILMIFQLIIQVVSIKNNY